MKRLAVLFIFLIVGFTIFVDISKGTIPNISTNTSTEPQKNEDELSYIIIEIQAGDTLFTLFEEANGFIPTDVERLITDFKRLNENIEPTEIQVNKEYKIPVYKEKF